MDGSHITPAPVFLGPVEAHRIAVKSDPVLRNCRELIEMMGRRADAKSAGLPSVEEMIARARATRIAAGGE